MDKIFLLLRIDGVTGRVIALLFHVYTTTLWLCRIDSFKSRVLCENSRLVNDVLLTSSLCLLLWIEILFESICLSLSPEIIDVSNPVFILLSSISRN